MPGVSVSGGGGGGEEGAGGGSRRKTSSQSSGGGVSTGRTKRLDSEILSEDRRSSRQASSGAAAPPPPPVPPPDSSEVSGRPGKVMASRLAWSSFWLRCHSASPGASAAPGGENGHGRPTEAARVEAPLVQGRSLLLLAGRSLRVTGLVREEPASCEVSAGWLLLLLVLGPLWE